MGDTFYESDASKHLPHWLKGASQLFVVDIVGSGPSCITRKLVPMMQIAEVK